MEDARAGTKMLEQEGRRAEQERAELAEMHAELTETMQALGADHAEHMATTDALAAGIDTVRADSAAKHGEIEVGAPSQPPPLFVARDACPKMWVV